jgi:uncharacterized protein (TIGR02145 family)
MIFKSFTVILTLIVIFFLLYCSDPSSNDKNENTHPTASFSFTPDIGDKTTVFEFNASNSSDKEDSTSSLEVRWDWENDGIWDTEYSDTKIISHQFLSEGVKSVTLEVKDSGGLVDTVINQLIISNSNTPPRASFTISLTSGSTSTLFEFDASDSWDDQDSTLLEYRWDWENDGIWDTDYTAVETASHQYFEEGTKIIMLEVLDSGGLTDTTTRQVVVSDAPFNDTTVTDIDGNIYKIVKIGDQYWMAENLKAIHYRNGDEIPNVADNTDWENLLIGGYCAYNNNDDYITTYGLLYNWYAVDDSRNIAPEGWHVPTYSEWQTLINNLGGQQTAGGEMKYAGTDYWLSPNTGATNSSGFSALPGGFRDRRGGFSSINGGAEFWVSDYEFSIGLANSVTSVGGTTRFKGDGASIRCVRD